MRTEDEKKQRLPTDVLIDIRPKSTPPDTYLAEVTLSNGSVFQHSFTLDFATLTAASTAEQGDMLYQALFRGGVREALGIARNIADNDADAQVRIRLRIAEAARELHVLPWEAVRRSANERPLAAARQTAFSRYISSEVASPPPLRADPLHLLVVIANPSDLQSKFGLAQVDTQAEIVNLHDALRADVEAQRLRVIVLAGEAVELPEVNQDFFEIVSEAVTLSNIAKHLLGCHLLHFIGHGAVREQQAAFYLERLAEDNERITDIVFSSEFANTLANAEPQLHTSSFYLLATAPRWQMMWRRQDWLGLRQN